MVSSLCLLFRDVYWFSVSYLIPDFYANIPALDAKLPCCPVFYVQYCARCVIEGGGPFPTGY